VSLISTVYVSSAVAPFSSVDLIELLRSAREKNVRAGLTGMLLYHDGNFIQMLEGPAESVDSLIQKLRLDSRHKDLLVLLRKTLDVRIFGEWQMAFRNTRELSPGELSEVSGYLEPAFFSSRLAKEGERSSAAMRLLEIFRDRLR